MPRKSRRASKSWLAGDPARVILSGAPQARSRRTAALDAVIDEYVQLKVSSSEGELLYESKLHDHLAFLMADVDFAYDKPTAAQYAVYDELQAAAKSAIAKLQAATTMATARF